MPTSRNDYYKTLSKEQKTEYRASLAKDRENAKWLRSEEKLIKEHAKETRFNIKRELGILKFMLKTDVMYNHHGRSESMKNGIAKKILSIKENKTYTEYHPYFWNYSKDESSYMPKSLLGNIFNSHDFESIYEVPLDGSYKFEIYDSGQRGMGSFNYITAIKVEDKFEAPYVNPGALNPITC